MKTRAPSSSAQLGFDALLADAAFTNAHREQALAAAHLPATFEEALPFYRALIERHHAAMLAAEWPTVLSLRNEAHRLAEKLNGFDPGICADDDAPGCRLENETRAPDETIPLWGQAGTFELACQSMRVRIEMDGLFGVGAHFMTWPGFGAHAVEWDKPFISETGYRSFLGLHGELCEGQSTEAFAAAVIEAHVARTLKGRLVSIDRKYRERAESAA
ncbi:MAG: hypothetical protein QOJ86_5008 [Bradyrhizobium sp.]|jgi:hypothetical protein|nr:hypothetical protein [Bradyrhizobium sp.]